MPVARVGVVPLEFLVLSANSSLIFLLSSDPAVSPTGSAAANVLACCFAWLVVATMTSIG